MFCALTHFFTAQLLVTKAEPKASSERQYTSCLWIHFVSQFALCAAGAMNGRENFSRGSTQAGVRCSQQ
jgi:hypothetical protein